MAGPDDQLNDDQEAERAADEYERLQRVLLEHIEEFIQEEDIGESYVVDLLVDAAVRLRMAAYGMYVEKPSVGGLKLDLDRFRQDVDELVRDAKRGADGYIDLVKETRARQESEPKAE